MIKCTEVTKSTDYHGNFDFLMLCDNEILREHDNDFKYIMLSHMGYFDDLDGMVFGNQESLIKLHERRRLIASKNLPKVTGLKMLDQLYSHRKTHEYLMCRDKHNNAKKVGFK